MGRGNLEPRPCIKNVWLAFTCHPTDCLIQPECEGRYPVLLQLGIPCLLGMLGCTLEACLFLKRKRGMDGEEHGEERAWKRGGRGNYSQM